MTVAMVRYLGHYVHGELLMWISSVDACSFFSCAVHGNKDDTIVRSDEGIPTGTQKERSDEGILTETQKEVSLTC